jgi:phospholipase/carboxylesterase
VQLDQLPPAAIIEQLVRKSLTLPHVSHRESRMAAPDTLALWIADEAAGGPHDAFIDDHEFCHIHAMPRGSLHLTLPPPYADEVSRLGWGEPHPAAEAGILNRCLWMVYAPRTETELISVLQLVEASYHFALGRQPVHRY